MTPGLIGKKIGMTRVFTEQGESRAVTVVEATPNRISQVKTAAADGYDALQVTVGTRRASRVSKAMQGHFAKAGVEPGRRLREFRIDPAAAAAAMESAMESALEAAKEATETAAETVAEKSPETAAEDAAENPAETVAETVAETPADATDSTAPDASATESPLSPGAELTVAMFSQGQKVDVTGRTIGKGFAGVMKRHGFRGGRATHGNSKAHRLAGATGNAQDPGRIFKGKKMAGQMGGVRRVQQGLEVVRVDAARNLLLISGAVPGPKGADVLVRPSVKSGGKNAGGKS
ncbi:MAG: 50S ribosomal protein L3 [Gammaproteobacteria bacterium]|nr:50S ribosomal protein L3 [Gammaproteobacteria bacterium]